MTDMMTGMKLVLSGLSVARGRTDILTDISLTLASSQIVGITGPNGAGKSTFLSAIGKQVGYGGNIQWDGQDVNLSRVGYMPQYSSVRADMSVLEAVLLGRHEQLGWRVKNADIDAAAAALTSFGMAHLSHRQMNTLSGGQQQLVLIAQRLVRKPDLLLLDESTSALDIHHQMLVMEHLRAYVRSSGALILIAMHDLNLATRHTDTMVMLSEGRLVAHGNHQNVLTMETIRKAYKIEAEVLHSSAGAPIIVPLSPSVAG